MIDRLRWFYRAWRYRLKVEKQEIRWLLQHLDPGEVALDIGAHKGAFTYWMRRRVGRAGKVFAFEPQPVLAARLQRLVTRAGYHNIVVERMGLSSQVAKTALKIPGRGSSPSASLERTEDSLRDGKEIMVEVTTLDEYFRADTAFRVRLIKCDVEGHELDVFRGAEQLLRRDHPHLLFESEARHLDGGTPREVFEFLEGLGFRGRYFGPDGLEDVGKFDPSVHQADQDAPGYVNNFVFAHRTESD